MVQQEKRCQLACDQRHCWTLRKRRQLPHGGVLICSLHPDWMRLVREGALWDALRMLVLYSGASGHVIESVRVSHRPGSP